MSYRLFSSAKLTIISQIIGKRVCFSIMNGRFFYQFRYFKVSVLAVKYQSKLLYFARLFVPLQLIRELQ